MAHAVDRCEFALTQLQLLAECCAQHHSDAGWRAAAQQVLQLLTACWNDIMHLAACCYQMLDSTSGGGGGGGGPGGLPGGAAEERPGAPAATAAGAGASADGSGPAGAPADSLSAEGAAAASSDAADGDEAGEEAGGRRQARLQQLLGFRAALGSSGVSQLRELEQLQQECCEALIAVLYSPACMPVAWVPAELLEGQPALQRKAAAWQAVLREQQGQREHEQGQQQEQQQEQQQQREQGGGGGGPSPAWPQPLQVMPGYAVELDQVYRQACPSAAGQQAVGQGAAAAPPPRVPVGLDLPFIQSQLELQASPALRRLVQQQGLACLGAGVMQVLPALQLVRQELAGTQGADSYASLRWVWPALLGASSSSTTTSTSTSTSTSCL